MPNLTKRRVSEAQDLEESYRIADRGSHPLALILLKNFTIQSFLPINLPPNVRLRQGNLLHY